MPQSVDVLYFEVELVSLPLEGYVLFALSAYFDAALTYDVWQ